MIEEVTTIVKEIAGESGVALDDLRKVYDEFVFPFLNKNPLYMGSMKLYSELYQKFQVLVTEQSNNDGQPDVRLLIYRDALQALISARDMYLNSLRSDKEILVVRNKWKVSQNLVKELLAEIATLRDDGTTGRFGGSLGIRIKKPKAMIYAQAILNLNLAWHIWLHGVPINYTTFEATCEYVKNLGTKEEAYNKLIAMLDEYYKDDEEDLPTIAGEITSGSSNEQTTSNEQTSSSDHSGSSCGHTSSSSEGTCSGSEHYESGDELPFDTYMDPTQVFGSNWKTTPVFVPFGGNNNNDMMLVMQGCLDVDIYDKYESRQLTRLKREKQEARENVRRRALAKEEVLFQRSLNLGDMLVLGGGLSIDVVDDYDARDDKQHKKRIHVNPSARHCPEHDHDKSSKKSKSYKKCRSKKHRKTCKSSEEDGWLNKSVNAIAEEDPLTAATVWSALGITMVLPGALSIDVRDQFDAIHQGHIRANKCHSTSKKNPFAKWGIGESVKAKVWHAPKPGSIPEEDEQLDLGDGWSALVMPGSLDVGIDHRIQGKAPYLPPKTVKAQLTKSCKKKKKKRKTCRHKKSSKNKTRKRSQHCIPTYMLDINKPGQFMLVVPGGVDIKKTQDSEKLINKVTENATHAHRLYNANVQAVKC